MMLLARLTASPVGRGVEVIEIEDVVAKLLEVSETEVPVVELLETTEVEEVGLELLKLARTDGVIRDSLVNTELLMAE